MTLRYRSERQGVLCTNVGRIIIDGKYYCDRHAGKLLLAWFLRNKETP